MSYKEIFKTHLVILSLSCHAGPCDLLEGE